KRMWELPVAGTRVCFSERDGSSEKSLKGTWQGC
ncbi:MAG: hypothetical protein H6R37_1305, partial [Deltaproteobacteria bacterium]|nr:hypothetical protein [Deltaproteobacteria bacterium]